MPSPAASTGAGCWPSPPPGSPRRSTVRSLPEVSGSPLPEGEFRRSRSASWPGPDGRGDRRPRSFRSTRSAATCDCGPCCWGACTSKAWRLTGSACGGWTTGARRPPRPAASEPEFGALASRLSFSSDRISVSGTTIGYRDLPTPWDLRAHDVWPSTFRVADAASVDGTVRSGSGAFRFREGPPLPLGLDAEFRLRGNRLHLDRFDLRSDLLTVDLNGSLSLDTEPDGEFRVSVRGDAGGLGRVPARFQRRLDTRGDPRDALRGDCDVRRGRVRAGRGVRPPRGPPLRSAAPRLEGRRPRGFGPFRSLPSRGVRLRGSCHAERVSDVAGRSRTRRGSR